MAGEDRRDIGVKFVFRQLGERIEIGQRLVDRLAQALLLASNVGGGGERRLERRQRIKQRRAFNTRRYGGFRSRLRLRRLAEVIGG